MDMAGAVRAWRMILGEAERLEGLAGRAHGEGARVARLAVMVLESIADKVLAGAVSAGDLERLEELETLLRLYGLPTGPVRAARSIVLRSSKIRPAPSPGVNALGGIIALA